MGKTFKKLQIFGVLEEAYFAKTLNFRFAVALEHRKASRTRLPPESLEIWRI
jgi:hypothetical protein